MTMSGSAQNRSEQELLPAVLAREPGAWIEFHQRYERLVVACVRKVLHRYTVPYTGEDLEDLLNAIYLELLRNDFKKLRAYDPERGYKLSSWVGLIATNAAHDALRRRGPQTQSLDDPKTPWPEATDATSSPADLALLRERQDLLNEAAKHLSPGEQVFLNHYYREGREPAEIAAILEISVNTVYSRKNKVRANLAKIVERLQRDRQRPRQDTG
ncbi:MAG: sigma-70 family RNA polymerase sigma factor [Deltaproteobacteria bacterium]|nr:sigma-70 family RNA polymerase sigma factor [Deltaproteobacteria bacterium]